jgi:hypothetical protein
MRTIVLVSLLAAGTALAGCVDRTVEERPVVVQPQPQSTIVVPQGSTIICPNGVAVPVGSSC